METNHAITALTGLAEQSRLAIFRLLIKKGQDGLSVGEIRDVLHLPPSSLSFHLKELVHANLIKRNKNGRFIIYSANFTTINDLIAFLTENCCSNNDAAVVCNPKPTIRGRHEKRRRVGSPT